MPRERPHNADGNLIRLLNNFKYQFEIDVSLHYLANSTKITPKDKEYGRYDDSY